MADERPTDEQLRGMRESPDLRYYSAIIDEVISSRAKLRLLGSALNEWKDHPVVRMITKGIAGK